MASERTLWKQTERTWTRAVNAELLSALDRATLLGCAEIRPSFHAFGDAVVSLLLSSCDHAGEMLIGTYRGDFLLCVVTCG